MSDVKGPVVEDKKLPHYQPGADSERDPCPLQEPFQDEDAVQAREIYEDGYRAANSNLAESSSEDKTASPHHDGSTQNEDDRRDLSATVWLRRDSDARERSLSPSEGSSGAGGSNGVGCCRLTDGIVEGGNQATASKPQRSSSARFRPKSPIGQFPTLPSLAEDAAEDASPGTGGDSVGIIGGSSARSDVFASLLVPPPLEVEDYSYSDFEESAVPTSTASTPIGVTNSSRVCRGV